MEFYERCAELLGVETEGQKFPHYKRTRWNNRGPGRGRFPGRGIIRKFGALIQVALTSPVPHHGIYRSEEEVYELLSSFPTTEQANGAGC